MPENNLMDDLLSGMNNAPDGGFQMWESNTPPNENPAAQQTIQGSRVPKNQQTQQLPQQTQPVPQQAQPLPQQPVPMPQQTVQQTAPMQMNTTVNNLSMLANKPNYTVDEWEQREELYVQECNKLVFDSNNVSGNFIAVMATKIDALLTPIRMDHIRMQQAVTKYENLIKVKEKLFFNAIKQTVNTKLTVDETKSLIADKIENEKIYDEGINLYEAVIRYGSRVTATKGFIDTLQDKKDLLILYSAVLKVENTANNFIPNVPTNNQFNQIRS